MKRAVAGSVCRFRKLQIKEDQGRESKAGREFYGAKMRMGDKLKKGISVDPSQVDNAKFCVFSRGGGNDVAGEKKERRRKL